MPLFSYLLQKQMCSLSPFRFLAFRFAFSCSTVVLSQIGDVAPKSAAVARWFISASLQGTFTAVNASFTSTNPLGDPTLAALQSVEFHDLVHSVLLLGPGDDGVPDFLVDDTPDVNLTPDYIFSSTGSGSTAVGAVAASAISVGSPVQTGSTATLRVDVDW